MKEQQRRQTDEAGVRLRSDVTIYPLDDDSVVFSEETQCLVGLNATATVVVNELEKGAPALNLVQVLVSEGISSVDEAKRWVTATLEALSSHGMLADGRGSTVPPKGTLDDDQGAEHLIAFMPPYAPVKPVAERHYRLLETSVLIRFAHSAQVRLVDSVIGHLAAEACSVPDVVLEIDGLMLDDGHLRSDIYRDGQAFGHALRLSRLGPIVKSALWQSAVNAYNFLFYLHAGVVRKDESCILLPGAAGSGKSSLTTALTHGGYSYFSDEVALIERNTFKVPPVPLAICVKATGWDLMARYYPDFSALPSHWRMDRRRVRYIPPPPSALQQSPAPVSHIIFPRYEKHARAELKPLSQSEALGRLMAECVAMRHRLDRTNVEKIVDWISGIECYSLTFASLDEAVELVTQVVNSDKN